MPAMVALDLITLIQAKAYLKVTFTDEDDVITSLIKAAIDQVEHMTEQRLYNRPEVLTTRKEAFNTPIYPIVAVTAIVQGDDTLVLNEDYYYYGDFDKAFHFDNCVNADEDPRIITLDVGYTAGNCPENLRIACLNLIEYWFNNRGASDVPANIEQRISTYKRLTWF